MQKVKRAYYYLFYKLYKHYENSSEPWWSDFKASASIGALEIWLILSILNYFLMITGETIGNLNIWQPSVFIPFILLFLLHYIAFIRTDIWKEYIKEFDQLSKEKNKKGGTITWLIIIFIIINTILSYYLLFQRAKQNQTGPYAPEIVAKERREDSLQKAQQIENLKKIYGEGSKK
ncbi:hypothetical protein [Chryseobacterium luteum]|uniref:Uncharacterized protein n=1 Tax=Chryseobacterium luteum TaxID=421531 RepID=A0A085ZHE7_9FLAO|nr:hypothetical protein [Chryseobacterium luteum]KFF03861.1 hypothetical protein IX38_10660 [Chryseobacterium luteum]